MKKPSVVVQAVIALLLINLAHKIVREIPGSFRLVEKGAMGGVATTAMALLIIASIILLLFGKRLGLILGAIPAAWLTVQRILVHVIWAYPDINGIWWYPLLPIVQGVLILYFSVLAWREGSLDPQALNLH